MAGLLCARAVGAEARDRAEDRRRRQLDAEALPDAGAQAFEDDVGFVEDAGRRLAAGVPGEDLLAGVQRLVRAGRGVPRGVSLWRLDLDDARSEPLQLAARERPGQVAGQIGDADPLYGFHRRRIMLPRVVSERTADRRAELLEAAVRVFAAKGFHASRVGDIANEAGVAHGLLYHYFRSKEELLETIFRETWRDVLDAVRSIEETDETARERLAGVAKILLRAWRRDPDLVRVLVREVTRSSHLQRRIDEIDQAFAGLERIIARGQEDGEFRADVDPRMASYVFYGALEEILTGWVLGQLDDGDEQIALAEQTVIEVVCGGLVRDREAAPL